MGRESTRAAPRRFPRSSKDFATQAMHFYSRDPIPSVTLSLLAVGLQEDHPAPMSCKAHLQASNTEVRHEVGARCAICCSSRPRWCEVRGSVSLFEGSQAVTVPLETAKMGAFFGPRGAGLLSCLIIKIDCESVPKIRD
jgi:hypothetical protein